MIILFGGPNKSLYQKYVLFYNLCMSFTGKLAKGKKYLNHFALNLLSYFTKHYLLSYPCNDNVINASFV